MWQAYDQLYPLGSRAADERMAFILANLVQVQTGGKSRIPRKPDLSKTPFTTADFMIDRRLRRVDATAPRPQRVRGPSMADISQVFASAGIVGRKG